jgi:hypothetical protein
MKDFREIGFEVIDRAFSERCPVALIVFHRDKEMVYRKIRSTSLHVDNLPFLVGVYDHESSPEFIAEDLTFFIGAKSV